MNPDRELEKKLEGPYVGPGPAPKRWGRMDAMSRLAVLYVGQALQTAGLLEKETGKVVKDKIVGLVAGTQYGCLVTDLDFIETLNEGIAMASPLLFSYTLPNTALAEAATQFGLTGPVYAIFNEHAYEEAQKEAQRWLLDKLGPNIMVAGELDIPPDGMESGHLKAKFIVLQT